MSSKTLPKGQPEFCFISPIDYLGYTENSSTRHLVLAHIIADFYSDDKKKATKAAKYIQHYKQLSDRGDYIICDNSAFELGESFSPDQLIELALLIGADALVLPDYPNADYKKTIAAAEAWITKFKDSGLDTFFVPQSVIGDQQGWMEGYYWAANNPDIDIIGWSILGIPNALPNVHKGYARVVMATLLKDRGFDLNRKYNHFLGLNAGPALEIPTLLKMGVLDSCDSSGPIWSAINGQQYQQNTDSLMAVNKSTLPHVDFYIDADATHSNAFYINSNIQLTNNLFNGDN